MLPLKWKIFRIANYLLIILLLAFIALISFYNRQYVTGIRYLAVLSIYVLCIGILVANCCTNLYLLEYCYPDVLPAKSTTIASLLFFVGSLLLLLALTGILVYGIHEEYQEHKNKVNYGDPTGLYVIAALFFFISGYGFVCWNQVVLKKAIRRNHRQLLLNFLANGNE